MSEQPAQAHGVAADPQMPKIGELLAERYDLQGLLGQGGFAAVYKALDTRASGQVAVKVLHPSKSLDKSFALRFRQEVMLCRQLQHPNTIKITDTGQTPTGCLYMVMEFVTGKELDRVIKRDGAFTQERTVHVGEQVLRALAEAHSKGIVHRDLKPPNIMISNLAGEEDFVKVLDFGIAKALEPEMSKVQTRAGLVFCTPKYAAPEILLSKGVTPAADVYSLGLIMIEMLTGTAAIAAPSDAEAIAYVLAPEPITIPPHIVGTPLEPVLRKSVAKPIEERYQSAKAMLEDLREVRRQQTTGSAPAITPSGMVIPVGPSTATTQPYHTGEVTTSRGGYKGLILFMVLVLAALGAGAFYVLQSPENTEPENNNPTPDPATQQAVAEVPVEPEPEPEPNWGGRLARPLEELAEIAERPPQDDTLAVLERVSLLDAAAQSAQNAVKMLRAALNGREIEEAHRSEARAEYLQATSNLIAVLIELDECDAAATRLELAFNDSALVAENSASDIAEVRGGIRECRNRVEEEDLEWDQRRYSTLLEEIDGISQRAAAIEDDTSVEFRDLLYQSVAKQQEALELLVYGLSNEEISARHRQAVARELQMMLRRVVLSQLSLELHMAAEVQLEEANQYAYLLPGQGAVEIDDLRQSLQAETEVGTGWRWGSYVDIVNQTNRLWARANGVELAAEEETPEEGTGEGEAAPAEDTAAEDTEVTPTEGG